MSSRPHLHPNESALALYAGSDLRGVEKWQIGWHVRRCAECHAAVEEFRQDQQRWAASADAMPAGVDWDRLSAEMTANIHLGIEAGECVAEATERPARVERWGWDWRPVAAAACLVVVFGAAWWLNLGARDAEVLGAAWNKMVTRATGNTPVYADGPVVAASSKGVEFRENGNVVGVNMQEAPVAVSVSFSGSASARYVDEDTSQVTIATVYVQ
ncbi:MAG: hypothetical protein WDO18_10245 [Acidobacteriota bacterium]